MGCAMARCIKKIRLTKYQKKIITILRDRGGCIVYNINQIPPYLIEGFGSVHRKTVEKLLNVGVIKGAGDGLMPETPQNYVLAQDGS